MIAYHRRTMHRADRFAQSLGYLDWANQPDPFRRYATAERIALDEVPPSAAPAFDDLAQAGRIPPRRLDRAALSQLLYDSLALSAWKEYRGSRWALRVNPSSGNLHPTEGYLLCDAVAGVSDGPTLFHYAPYHHALERRWRFTAAEWAALTASLPAGSMLFGLTSIHWRESWKYGERAWRYCQHDAGHAIAAVSLAAAALGWQAQLVQGLGDDSLRLLLGVHHQQGIEAEHADCLLLLHPAATDRPIVAPHLRLPGDLRRRMLAELDDGAPEALSADHHEWPIIDDVTAACLRPEATIANDAWSPGAPPALPRRPLAARTLIRQRRSAVAMDGKTSIDRGAFYAMLAKLHPSLVPFRSLAWRPAVHLAIFVHRVAELEPGLYLLLRDASSRQALQSSMRQEFRWQRPPGCPDDVDLWMLALGGCDNAARAVCCNQDIAADGAFALGMLAEFEPRLRARGAWYYRCLHWETGAIGQVLYLEAEAAGVRATGIGCFLDDLMHEILGIAGAGWQTLYHFTVGGAVEDERLRTLDAYAHRSPSAMRDEHD